MLKISSKVEYVQNSDDQCYHGQLEVGVLNCYMYAHSIELLPP